VLQGNYESIFNMMDIHNTYVYPLLLRISGGQDCIHGHLDNVELVWNKDYSAQDSPQDCGYHDAYRRYNIPYCNRDDPLNIIDHLDKLALFSHKDHSVFQDNDESTAETGGNLHAKEKQRNLGMHKLDTHKLDAHKLDGHAHKLYAHKLDGHAHKLYAHKLYAHKLDAHKLDAHKLDAHKLDAHYTMDKHNILHYNPDFDEHSRHHLDIVAKGKKKDYNVLLELDDHELDDHELDAHGEHHTMDKHNILHYNPDFDEYSKHHLDIVARGK